MEATRESGEERDSSGSELGAGGDGDASLEVDQLGWW